jgi:hypothetical protein
VAGEVIAAAASVTVSSRHAGSAVTAGRAADVEREFAHEIAGHRDVGDECLDEVGNSSWPVRRNGAWSCTWT